MPALETDMASAAICTRPSKATTLTALVPTWMMEVPLASTLVPMAARTSWVGSTRTEETLVLTSVHLMAAQLPWAPPKAAPHRLPTSAWLELEGNPSHQVRKFQAMAETSPQTRMPWVTNWLSTKPEEMVLATASPKNDPKRL